MTETGPAGARPVVVAGRRWWGGEPDRATLVLCSSDPPEPMGGNVERKSPVGSTPSQARTKGFAEEAAWTEKVVAFYGGTPCCSNSYATRCLGLDTDCLLFFQRAFHRFLYD